MTLDARLDVRVEDAVTFALTVTNATTQHVELTFYDGQTADVIVHEDGVEDDHGAGASDGELRDIVWRWSDGRMFTQAIRTSTLAPGEQAREEMIWEDPIPGTYTAVATLKADDVSVHAQNDFEVP
ncbi:MAG: BsuPI-related putative proteinase inhibitor [Halobacteriales archaeon]